MNAPRARRILIVDDEESIRTFVQRALASARYDTFVAEGGAEALNLAEANAPIDLLLADVFMPEMRGDELAQRMRLAKPTLEVIYLTGHINELMRLRPGISADDIVLEKPCSIKVLTETVSSCLFGHPRGPAGR